MAAGEQSLLCRRGGGLCAGRRYCGPVSALPRVAQLPRRGRVTAVNGAVHG